MRTRGKNAIYQRKKCQGIKIIKGKNRQQGIAHFHFGNSIFGIFAALFKRLALKKKKTRRISLCILTALPTSKQLQVFTAYWRRKDRKGMSNRANSGSKWPNRAAEKTGGTLARKTAARGTPRGRGLGHWGPSQARRRRGRAVVLLPHWPGVGGGK